MLDGFGVYQLGIAESTSGGGKNGGLVGYGYYPGQRPETYALEMANGTSIEGVFLGTENRTTWGFRAMGSPVQFWGIRFLWDGGLRDGEVGGLLKIIGQS